MADLDAPAPAVGPPDATFVAWFMIVKADHRAAIRAISLVREIMAADTDVPTETNLRRGRGRKSGDRRADQEGPEQGSPSRTG